MLNNIKTLFTGILAKIILIILTLAFVFVGFYGYDNPGVNELATVGGEPISARQFNQEYSGYLEQIGDEVRDMDEEQVSNYKYSVLQNIISRKLYINALKNLTFYADDQRVLEALVTNSAYQTDGRFNKAKLDNFLTYQGVRQEEFERSIREGLMLSDFDNFLKFSVDKDIAQIGKKLIKHSERTFNIHYLAFDQRLLHGEDFAPSKEEITQKYELNKADYVVNIMYDLRIVRFDKKDLVDRVSVNDAESSRYLRQNSSKYTHPPRYQISRIFLPKKKYSKARAENILKDATENPDQFQELTEKYSQDPEYASTSGVLPMVNSGLDPLTDFRASQMKEGEVGEVLQEDEDAYVIIKLINYTDSKPKTLEEAREQVEYDVKLEKAGSRMNSYYQEILEKVVGVEATADYDFQQLFESEMGKVVFTEKNFDDSKPLANQFNARTFYFSLQDKKEGDKDNFEFEDGSFIFYIIDKIHPSRQKSLDEVQVDIKTELTESNAQVELDKIFTEYSEKVTDHDSYANMLEELKAENIATAVSFTKSQGYIQGIGQSAETIDKIDLLLDEPNTSARILKTTENNTNYIIRFDGVTESEIGDELDEQRQTALGKFVEDFSQTIYSSMQSSIIENERNSMEVVLNNSTLEALGIAVPEGQ